MEAIKSDFVLAALISDSPSIVALRKIDSDKCDAKIMSLITEVVASVNVGKNMNSLQVRAAAQIISKDYYFLKLKELEQCFIHGVTGKYGPLYDKLDVNTLCGWLIKYTEERVDACEIVRSDEKANQNFYDFFKEEPGEKNVLLDAMKNVNSIIKIEKRVVAPMISDEARKKQAEVREFNIWIDQQWQIRVYEQGVAVNESGIVRIKYKGKSLTRQEFAQSKWDQVTRISESKQ